MNFKFDVANLDCRQKHCIYTEDVAVIYYAACDSFSTGSCEGTCCQISLNSENINDDLRILCFDMSIETTEIRRKK